MIWVTGADGMLGRELTRALREAGLAWTGSGRGVDITNEDALASFARGKPIDWLVNCAAYTNVDRAESDAELCFAVNARGAEAVSRAAKQLGARLIHISTDYVFNGESRIPYKETDETNPAGVYGRSKRDGEAYVLAAHKESYIIRTAWLYGEHGRNFVNTMLRLMSAQRSVTVVADQRGSPTWTRSLASVILALITTSGRRGADIPFGIYHAVNAGECTWFDFAREIYAEAREAGMIRNECAVLPCTSAEFGAKVKRPAYSALDTGKLRAALGITLPGWKDALHCYIQSIRDTDRTYYEKTT